jgi:hypothetical protein
VGFAMRAARPSSARRNPVFGNREAQAIDSAVGGGRVFSQETAKS